MRVNSFLSSKRGTTLVEILVAMVVLLVGILTVVQLFPTGFRVVRAAESQTIATRLAQQELERWKNLSASIPAGILAVDEAGNVLNEQVPGPPFEDFRIDPATGKYATADNGRYERGNALNIRQVVGESTTIPIGSYFQSGQGAVFGSRYTLAFSPIEAWRDGDGVLQGLTIKSGDLRRRIAESSYDPPYLRQGQYAIDYDLSTGDIFHVAFPQDSSSGKRVFYISYSYWASKDPGDANVEPELLSVVDQQLTVDGSDSDWVEVPIKDLPSGYTVTEMEPRTDSCARGFIEQAGDFTPDPYEFKLVDSIVGVIAFNPAGRGMYEYTAKGVRPIEARISYLISDTRIIREDRVVPQPEPSDTRIPVKFALRYILNVGDTTDNPDEEEGYRGLVKDHDGSIAVPIPVLVIDLTTGWRVDVPMSAVSFRDGIVNLPIQADLIDYAGTVQAPAATLAGRHLRFFYRADGDWSVQCSKAYETYARKYGTNDSLDYRTYKIPSSGSGLANRMYFAPCEAFKTVLVDYTYITPDGAEHKVSGEAHQINLPVSGSDWCIDLSVPDGAYIPANGRIVVVGASFNVKVIWRDGKNWRHVNMDTQLTKG